MSWIRRAIGAPWALAALAALLASLGPAQAVEVSITTPKSGETVDWRDTVAGLVSDPAVPVWVIVRPFTDSQGRPLPRARWVQPKTSVEPDGRWSVLAYFAEESAFYRGFTFKVRACAGPKMVLTVGQILYQWPSCAHLSPVVLVTRD
jgi:hypothetical protein